MRKLLLWVLALTCASAIAQTQPETRSGSIVVGQPTQDNKGPGSINAQSIYVNGVAVGTGGGTVTTSGTPASGNIAAFSSPNAITPATAAQVAGLWTGTGSGSNCLGGNGALIACGGTVGSGTAGQVAVYSSTGTVVAGSSTLDPNTTSATSITEIIALNTAATPIYVPAGVYTVPGSYTTGAPLTISVPIQFAPGAQIVCSGTNLHFTNTVTAGRYMTFQSGCTPLFNMSQHPGGQAPVEWWGAVADYANGGTGTGTDNGPAIAAALASLANGNANLSFCGNYRYATGISSASGQIRLAGCGGNSSLLWFDDPAGTNDAIYDNGGAKWVIDSLTVQAIQAHTAGACIHARNASYFQIRNSFVGNNCWQSVWWEATASSGQMVQPAILNTNLQSAINDNLYISAASGGSIVDYVIDKPSYILNAGNAGIEATGATFGYIDARAIYNNNHGILTDTSGSGFFMTGTSVDTNTGGNSFTGLSNSKFTGVHFGNSGTTTCTLCVNITETGSDYTGNGTTNLTQLQLLGVTQYNQVGAVYGGNGTAPVTISPSGSTGSTIVSITTATTNNGSGNLVTFSGSPTADHVTLEAQLSTGGGALYTGSPTNLTVIGPAMQVAGMVTSGAGAPTLGAGQISYGATSAPTLTGANGTGEVRVSSANGLILGGNGSAEDVTIVDHNGTVVWQISTGGLTAQMPNIPSDATHTTATVCKDTTTNSFLFGSGTAGICLGTSSARYKHDREPLEYGLNAVMALDPISYELNADHGDPNKVLFGFTAEQMQPVIPELVGLDAEGKPNTADYLGLVPVLVKAVQEQQKEIELLKRKLRTLH